LDRDLAEPDCPLRAVFLEGGPQYGKTFLLECLKSEVKIRIILVALDKRKDVPTPIQLLSEIVTPIGWEHFPTFSQAMKEQQPHLHATISNVSVEGSYVNVLANTQENENDRLISAIHVTAGFLNDLRKALIQPLILAFDGYDANMSLIDRWFDSILVQGLCGIEHLRLIVCGREVPTNTVKRRGPAGRFVELLLEGIPDAGEWSQIIAALNCRIPGDDDKNRSFYLRGMVDAFKGAPGHIVTHLKTLTSA
jgi:hypothetical protein